MTDAPTIGFLGCGRMAAALAGGLVESGFAPAARVLGSARGEATRAAFREATGGAATVAADGDPRTFVERCDVLVLAVKPHQIRGVLEPAFAGEPLIVSLAAGVPLAKLEAWAAAESPPDPRVIRVMPNTPSLVGAGAAGFARGTHATDADAAFVRAMLECVGVAEEAPEPLLDAVTAVSGSGPAYGFLFLEALADGGVRAGLPRTQAVRLATATLRGAAALVEQTGEHPAALKDAVCSPGGTTIAAVAALEAHGFRAAIHAAVAAAAARSRAMAEE